MKLTIPVLALCLLFGLPATTRAFCGFYVSGADASLYNQATMVVLMREGTRTVLSMQNNYQGPPEDFAMVVPVPVVLQEENVKTLPKEIFARVDKLAAPRLVEYWEQDPCRPVVAMEMALSAAPSARRKDVLDDEGGAADLGVTIEAQFKVAEYDIVVLSAKDSGGLDKWLRKNRYNIPKGAEKLLRPYVEQNTKFFVAKVDASKVKFQDGRAVLSPLRFHYDSPTFTLPVRLGLLNSGGEQDLLVHVLAKGQRYEVANYANASIPTNIVVEDSVRTGFGGFYEALFQRTIDKNPGAVITEYAWDATSCDPCPEPPLTQAELATLGADVIVAAERDPYSDIPGVVPRRSRPRPYSGGFVLTRLHYRYDKNGLDEDLVFRQAGPIIGGRGMPDQEGRLEERRAQPSGLNNFQGRYVILHRWEGNLACDQPLRGVWGGPPGSPEPRPVTAPSPLLRAGDDEETLTNRLPQLIRTDIPELGLEARTPAPEPEPTPQGGEGPSNPSAEPPGNGCRATAGQTASLGWIALIIVAMCLRRRAVA